jgi:hypothetical protein
LVIGYLVSLRHAKGIEIETQTVGRFTAKAVVCIFLWFDGKSNRN